MTTAQKPQEFYVGDWGTWGWIETGVKAAAAAIGLAAFFASAGASGFMIAGNPELLALLVCAGLCTNPLISLVARITQKEIISIVFTVFSLFGHLGLLVALARDPLAVRGFALAFGALYVSGELAKMRFLMDTGYTEFGLALPTMLRGVAMSAGLYTAFTLLVLL